MNSTLKNVVFWVVLIVVAALVYNVTSGLSNPHKHVMFSEFVQSVDKEEIDEVTFTGEEITYTTKTTPAPNRGSPNPRTVHRLRYKAGMWWLRPSHHRPTARDGSRRGCFRRGSEP